MHTAEVLILIAVVRTINTGTLFVCCRHSCQDKGAVRGDGMRANRAILLTQDYIIRARSRAARTSPCQLSSK